MTQPTDYTVTVTGGWRDNPGQPGRRFALDISDPTSRRRIAEVILPETVLLRALQNYQDTDQPTGTLRFYGLSHVGQVVQRANLWVELPKGLSEELRTALFDAIPGGAVWSLADLLNAGGWGYDARYNHHRLVGTPRDAPRDKIDSTAMLYRLAVERLVPPDTELPLWIDRAATSATAQWVMAHTIDWTKGTADLGVHPKLAEA